MHVLRLPRASSEIALAIVAALWVAAMCAGIAMLTAYSNIPGPAPSASSEWPALTHLQLNHTGPTLIVFAHPHCPCSRATLGELEKIQAINSGTLQTYVVFIKPLAIGRDWDDADLRKSALAIPGVQVIDDVDGVEARRFGARTSGQTVFYNQRGEKLFSGGITAARGHSGDNAGRAAIEKLIKGGSPDASETPVFGCPLESLRREG